MVHFTRWKHTRMINHNTSLQFMELFASDINQIHRKKQQFTTHFQALSASQDFNCELCINYYMLLIYYKTTNKRVQFHYGKSSTVIRPFSVDFTWLLMCYMLHGMLQIASTEQLLNQGYYNDLSSFSFHASIIKSKPHQ